MRRTTAKQATIVANNVGLDLRLHADVLRLLLRSIEMHIAIVCACMPTLRPLIRSSFSFIRESCSGDSMGSRPSQHRAAQRTAVQEIDGSIEMRKIKTEKVMSPYYEDVELVGEVPMNPHNKSDEAINDAHITPMEPRGTF